MLAIIGTVVLIALLTGLLIFNRLTKARNYADQRWTEIDEQLRRRRGLVSAFVESIGAYKLHELGILGPLTQARDGALAGGDVDKLRKAENILSQQMRLLLTKAESLPKANESDYRDLQKVLMEVEDQIQVTRRQYNGAVHNYNKVLESFPHNLLSESFGFRKERPFEMEYVTDRKTPDAKSGG